MTGRHAGKSREKSKAQYMVSTPHDLFIFGDFRFRIRTRGLANDGSLEPTSYAFAEASV